MQPNKWRAIEGKPIKSSGGVSIGFVRESACYPDDFFWANPHPLFGKRRAQSDDIAVPAAYIARSDGHVYLSISREEFLALPQRWQGDPPEFDRPSQTAMERFWEAFRYGGRLGDRDVEAARSAGAMDRFATPYRTDRRRNDPGEFVAEPFRSAPKPSDVTDLGERAILEIRQTRERAAAFEAQYGPFSPEEQAIQEKAMERRIAQIQQHYERALATVMED